MGMSGWRKVIVLIIASAVFAGCNNYDSPTLTPETGLFEQALQNTIESAIGDTTHVLELSQLSLTEIKTRNAAVKVVEALTGNHGSGTYMQMYGRFVVVTADHVVEQNTTMQIHGRDNEVVVARVIYRSPKTDLAVLATPQLHTRVAMKWKPRHDDKNILGTNVAYTGFPGRHDLLTIRGHVASLERGHVVANMFGWFGASGAGVFDQRGRFIGVVSAIDAGNWQIPIPLDSIVWVSPGWNFDEPTLKSRVITSVEPGILKAMPGAQAPRRGNDALR
jgi:S1-C subfamily serine protease